MLIINLIDKDRIRGDDYGDSRAVWRARLFLFIGFAFMAGGLAGSVVRLISPLFETAICLTTPLVPSCAQIYHEGLPGAVYILWLRQRLAECGPDAVGSCALDRTKRAD